MKPQSSGTSPARRAALGCRSHSGWAVVVAVAGSRDSLTVIDRRRIEIADVRIAGSKQPYHAAEPLELQKAEQLINRCRESTRLLARQAFRAIVEDVQKQGYETVGCGILLASGRPTPALAATLASHAAIHTAEGEFFRDALAHASQHCGVPVTGIKERELHDCGAAELGLSASELLRQVNEMGRALGPPWRQDEKLATLVGWLALTAAHKR
jgi:hypothetical protein